MSVDVDEKKKKNTDGYLDIGKHLSVAPGVWSSSMPHVCGSVGSNGCVWTVVDLL